MVLVTQNKSSKKSSDVADITKEISGFSVPENVIVSYNSTARKITLTGNTTCYFHGKLITALISGWVSGEHGTATGIWFLYYNGTDFVRSQLPWLFSMVQIAFVSYGTTYKFGIRESHGIMQWQNHKELHETIGTYMTSGATLTGITPLSTTPSARRPIVSDTVINDEDLQTTIATLTSSLYTKHFISGSGATTNFTIETADIVPLLGNNPYYNKRDGVNWIQTLMSNNSYMSVWLMAIPVTADAESQKYRYVWVQGQSNGTLAQEQALIPASLNLGQIASIASEFVFVGKIILRYTGGNWHIQQTEKLTGNKYNQVSIVNPQQANQQLAEFEGLYKIGYDSYKEYVYTGENITQVNVWDTSAKVTKLFTKDITYTLTNPTSIVLKDEITLKTLTTTLTYSGANIATVTKVLA